MSDEPDSDALLYENLQALADTSFPKRCLSCDVVYRTPGEFINQTQRVGSNHSGLKSVEEDDGVMVVELFRNCHCGSTLMDSFNNRRDISEGGAERRQKFGELMQLIQSKYGVDALIAREELLKILRGGESKLIKLVRD